MKDLKFTIPVDPKPKKNSQSIIKVHGRPMVIQGKTYREYEATCKKYVPRLTKPITEPVVVECIFYRRERRTVDLANLQAAINDILVKYGVLADDNRDIIASGDGSRVYWDKANPRTEVTIKAYEGRYEQWKTQKDAEERTE